jgi:hypothetical protein
MDNKEAKKKVIDCLSQFNDENENVVETLFNIYPAEMNGLIRLVKNCSIPNVVQQSELLISFLNEFKNYCDLDVTPTSKDVDRFLRNL